jgi:hypothetical protein
MVIRATGAPQNRSPADGRACAGSDEPLPSPWVGRASRLAMTVCGPHRVTGYDHRIILICHEGYASSLARWLCTTWACTAPST